MHSAIVVVKMPSQEPHAGRQQWQAFSSTNVSLASFCRERQNSTVEWAFPALFGDKFYLPG
jgi:hypothetical protein